jgi:hypothetical protein
MDILFQKKRITEKDTLLFIEPHSFFESFYVPYCHYIKKYNLRVHVWMKEERHVKNKKMKLEIEGEEMENNIVFLEDTPLEEEYNVILYWNSDEVPCRATYHVFFLELDDVSFSKTVSTLDKRLHRVQIHVIHESYSFFHGKKRETMLIYGEKRVDYRG